MHDFGSDRLQSNDRKLTRSLRSSRTTDTSNFQTRLYANEVQVCVLAR